MPSIFGTVGGEGLTNPLEKNLLADGFDIENLDTLYLNGLEANSGVLIEVKNNLDLNQFEIIDLGKLFVTEVHGNGANIVVHEELNMTNKKIGNMATPTQTKDAATKGYVDGLVGGASPYDMQMAFTDNTSVIAIGYQPPYYYTPRAITGISCVGFLRIPCVSVSQTFNVYVSNQLIAVLTFPVGSQTQSNTQTPWLNPAASVPNSRIFVENISTATDPNARGLLITITGTV